MTTFQLMYRFYIAMIPVASFGYVKNEITAEHDLEKRNNNKVRYSTDGRDFKKMDSIVTGIFFGLGWPLALPPYLAFVSIVDKNEGGK